MNKVDVVLLVALVASSLYLVGTSYESRRLYAAIDRARADERALGVELERLEAERRAQATHLRVEKVAREKLAMRGATPAVMHYVQPPVAAAEVLP